MWTRSNLITISLTGQKNTVKCNCCGAGESFEQSDRFTEVMRPHFRNSRALKKITTPKAFIAWFLDEHFHQHVTAIAEAEAQTAVAV